jgi:parallel beta-helix repeat protein
MFTTTPLSIKRDGQVTFAKPGDTVYVYLRTDGQMIMSNAVPAYATFMDFSNGRWRLQIDDNRVNANIVVHTFLIADSMTYPVPSGYSLRSGVKKVPDYGTVFVYGSLYKERLEIDRPMRLISTSRAVLDGGNLDAIVQVKANSVMIDGFEIKNSGSDAFISGGIVVHEGVVGTVIRNNNIHHCSNAIWLWGADSVIVQNNTLYRNDNAGILMEGGAHNNYVKYNTAYENMYGILVIGGNYNTINENVFHDNDKYAIYIENYKALQNICEYNDFGNDDHECVDMAIRE